MPLYTVNHVSFRHVDSHVTASGGTGNYNSDQHTLTLSNIAILQLGPNGTLSGMNIEITAAVVVNLDVRARGLGAPPPVLGGHVPVPIGLPVLVHMRGTAANHVHGGTKVTINGLH